MKNKRGFTLVELLAVIVVLAIIIVIATMSVNGIIKKNKTEEFVKSFDVAVMTAKEMLASDEKLTTKSLTESLDYSSNDYEYFIQAYEGENYIIIKSKNTGKFKNVDFDVITKNAKYTYIKDENGENIIGVKINDNAVVTKTDIITEEFVDYITEKYPKTCTFSPKKNKYEKGDIISFCNKETGKSEEFYVIKDDGTTVTALAKYNLMVGEKFDGNEYYELTESNTTDFGLQSIDTVINPEGASYSYGISFANEEYWDNTASKIYNEKSNLYAPLQKYKAYLEGLGKNIEEIRLITYDEIESLCSINMQKLNCNKNGKDYSWIYTTNYWTDYANSSTYSIVYSGNILSTKYYYSGTYGARPVIEINKSEL